MLFSCNFLSKHFKTETKTEPKTLHLECLHLCCTNLDLKILDFFSKINYFLELKKNMLSLIVSCPCCIQTTPSHTHLPLSLLLKYVLKNLLAISFIFLVMGITTDNKTKKNKYFGKKGLAGAWSIPANSKLQLLVLKNTIIRLRQDGPKKHLCWIFGLTPETDAEACVLVHNRMSCLHFHFQLAWLSGEAQQIKVFKNVCSKVQHLDEHFKS